VDEKSGWVASGSVGRRKGCMEEKVEERMVVRTWKTNLFVFGWVELLEGLQVAGRENWKKGSLGEEESAGKDWKEQDGLSQGRHE
jgi:hypothetical protein